MKFKICENVAVKFGGCLFTILTLMFVPQAYSQTAEEFGVLINLSGKQRMLTQKMSKEVLLIALDINKTDNLANLKATSNLFDKTLKGLRNGDAELLLPPTSSKRILRQLGKVDSLWSDFYPNIQNIMSDNAVTQEQITAIALQNLPLLKQMNKAVGAYEKEAAKGGLKAAPGLAATLNLSGKQRMLTQKMSKEFLLIAYGQDATDNRLSLLETFTLFERTLKGLKDGDETLGLPATSEVTILSQLDTIMTLWKKAKPVFEMSSAQGSTISQEQIISVAGLNLPLLKEMNEAVGMYE